MRRMMMIAAALCASVVTAHATEKTYTFSAAPGSCDAPIAIPFNKPVILAGVNIVADNRGTAQVTILHTGKVLTWAGVDLVRALEGGSTQSEGITVAYLDFHGLVSLVTAGATHIEACNSSDNTADAKGSVTLLY